MLPRNAIAGAVVIGVVAFYCKLWNVQLLQDEQKLLQQLQNNRVATEPVILYLGKSASRMHSTALRPCINSQEPPPPQECCRAQTADYR